jgi:ribosomal protein L19E
MKKLHKVVNLCSRMLNIGRDRIKFHKEKIDQEFKLDFSRKSVKGYLKTKLLTIKPIKGTTRHVKSLPVKNMKGKRTWVQQVRRLRSYLKELIKEFPINNRQYRFIYLKVKANTVSTRKQLYNLTKNVFEEKT